LPDEPNPDIWPPYESFYIHAMLFSTRSALNSLQIVNRSLDRAQEWVSNAELRARDQEAILDGIQNIVSCGAALSRYFWPARSGRVHAARARRLRSSLGVTSSNALKNRDLRNLIEHFDERLDTYLSEGIAGHIFPEFVANRPEAADIPTHVSRAYYTEVAVFEVLGRQFEIKPIVTEITRLHEALTECLRRGSVLPRE
jgi:hypothetical protein